MKTAILGTKIAIGTSLLIIILLISCKSPDKTQNTIDTIDVIAGLKNAKEFRLSDLVGSIEYVKLETRPECLVSSASIVVGNKYIVLLNSQPSQILLFDRTGKFLHPIGKIGKGPGEYTMPIRIDLNPDENRIITYDMVQRKFLEYSVDGTLMASPKAPEGLGEGPIYLDSQTIGYMQAPWDDSLHFPRVVAMNTETGVQKPLWFNNYRHNPDRNLGYYLGNDFFRTDEGIIFKDALCDTIFQVSQDLSAQPVFILNSFTPKPPYYSMTETEMDALSNVSPDCSTPGFLFLIGGDPDRFHMVYNRATKETFRLAKLSGCLINNRYEYGLINDLDGTDPVWFWEGSAVRGNQICNLLQIVNLQEKIKTDCFTKSDLKTKQYRDELQKLVETSSENDNPIIRILHLK